MEVEKVRKYTGKKCFIVLKNDFKFTAVIPEFSGNCFDIIDKYGASVSIDCSMINLISELNGDRK